MIVVSNNTGPTICSQRGVFCSPSPLPPAPVIYSPFARLEPFAESEKVESNVHLRSHRQWSVDEFYRSLSSAYSPSFPSLLSPNHPLLSAQWKSLITGGESNPWHWMKDRGLPPSVSFSQSLSLSSFFPWMLAMLGRFSPLCSPSRFPAPSFAQCFRFPFSFYKQVKGARGSPSPLN